LISNIFIMTAVDYQMGGTAIGSIGSGGDGGGSKAPRGGGDPPRKHYKPKGGDVESRLWLYDLRSASSYLNEWRKYSSFFFLLFLLLLASATNCHV
jgi:hypothetical protein